MANLVNDWWTAPNEYLNRTHEDHNAEKVYWYFKSQGWTKNAIAGMCGNMHVESRINPGLWQGRSVPANVMTTNKGYGLTQWTPARKYINWALDSGYSDYGNGDYQLARITWEWQNKQQWSLNNLGSHTWNDFVYSTESPERLARVFCWAYERPSNPNMELRQQNARYYYDLFERLDPSPDPPTPPSPDPPTPPDPTPEPDFPGYNNGLTIDQLFGWLNANQKRRKKRIVIL